MAQMTVVMVFFKREEELTQRSLKNSGCWKAMILEKKILFLEPPNKLLTLLLSSGLYLIQDISFISHEYLYNHMLKPNYPIFFDFVHSMDKKCKKRCLNLKMRTKMD